jgi:asparagine synthase (glutamine-hydrolysing)
VTRIAGTFPAQGQAAVTAMLDAMRPRVEAAADLATCEPAALGVLGPRDPKVARRGPLTCVVDASPITATDVLDAYEKHGMPGALAELAGDFAIALYDERTRTLWLARDRFGVKPLYYAHRGGWFAFASRLRGLLAQPDVSSTPNRAFVARFAGLHYRTFDNVPRESPYADIAQLPAASYLEVRDDKVREATYWALVEQPDFSDERELAARYRELLLDAVAVRRRAAHRPAFTLSGGMDSSSVIACSVRASGAREHAYSTVYRDPTYDETDQIRTILDATVEQWHPVVIGDPDLATVIPRMIEINDEPIATATWLSHYLMCEQVGRDGFVELFGGLGGDELNAGEYEYFYFFFADLAARGERTLLDHETERWVHYHDHPIFKKSHAAMEDGLRRLVDLSVPGRCRPDPARLARYRDTVRPDYFDLSSFEPVMDEPFTSYLKNRTYQDIYRETAPCCLRAADRQTEAFGLEVVWPFFDHRLVELMFRVPGTMKIRDGVTKHLLREATRDILPESTRTRVTKTGWNAPAHVWFATGSGRDLVLDLASSQAFRERGIYDVARVTALLDEHRDIVVERRATDNHMMFFWQLVNLELWARS